MKNNLHFNRTQAVSLGLATVSMLAATFVLGILGVHGKALTWAFIAVMVGGLIGTIAGAWNTSSPKAGAWEWSALFALGWGGMAVLLVYGGIVTHDNEVIVIGAVFAVVGLLSIAWALRSSRSAP